MHKPSNGELTSEQITSSYRNLFSIFRENNIPYEKALEITNNSNPEDLMCALKKVNDLAYRKTGKSGFDFGYLCGNYEVRSLLEIYADDEKNPNKIIAMITTHDPSVSYLCCNPDGVFWRARCFASRKDIKAAAEAANTPTNSQIEIVCD